MRQYIELLKVILEKGALKTDRTGTGTLSIFGHSMRFNLAEGFPLVTTKKVHLKSVIHELLWFLRGDTNVHSLQEHGVTIWDEWADKKGGLGPVYGKQWREWECADGRKIDQISEAIALLKHNPDSRRNIVSAWNPADVEKVTLPWCHCFFQFYVAERKLSCQVYQRSCDTFLGVPFNIASYALLTMMMAQVCNLGLGELIWVGGDVHLYLNHLDQARAQILREPRPLPTIKISSGVKDIDRFQFWDFELAGYDPHPSISAPVSV